MASQKKGFREKIGKMIRGININAMQKNIKDLTEKLRVKSEEYAQLMISYDELNQMYFSSEEEKKILIKEKQETESKLENLQSSREEDLEKIGELQETIRC